MLQRKQWTQTTTRKCDSYFALSWSALDMSSASRRAHYFSHISVDIAHSHCQHMFNHCPLTYADCKTAKMLVACWFGCNLRKRILSGYITLSQCLVRSHLVCALHCFWWFLWAQCKTRACRVAICEYFHEWKVLTLKTQVQMLSVSNQSNMTVKFVKKLLRIFSFEYYFTKGFHIHMYI